MATIRQIGVTEKGKKTWNWIPPREWMEPLAGLPHEDLMTVQDAARSLNISTGIIYSRIREGLLPFTQIGGIYLIRREDAKNWVRLSRGRPVGVKNSRPYPVRKTTKKSPTPKPAPGDWLNR